MKIVIREWKKDKAACAMLFVWFAISIVYITVNAKVVILLSNAFADPTNLKKHLMIIGGVCLFQTILSMFRGYLRTVTDKHCFTYLNNLYADKMIDSDYELFTKFSIANVTTAQEFLAKIVKVGFTTMQMILNMYSICVTLYNMYIIGGKMVIPVIIIYAIGAFIFSRIYKLYVKIDEKFQTVKRKRNQEMENVINGFQEVKSFNTGEAHRSSIHNHNHVIYDTLRKKASINAILWGSIDLVDTAGFVVVIIYVMGELAKGTIEQAAGMSLVMYVWRLVEPLLSMLDFIDDLSDNLTLAKDYDAIISYKNRNNDDGKINLREFNHEIVLKDVGFSYDDSSTAINNVNIKIEKGQRVGICGASGGGKSTLFKLINRFYKVTSGTITIDGFNINDVTLDSYRRHIGSVHQENAIFPGSIRMNIMYGSPNALDAELIEACKKANIYEFICSLPEKFETEVGPRGLKLSGGQKQRIALARMFLRNPEIILLDEATSALDNESETLIQDAIDQLEGKTIITVAHRLSTIKDCDKIYVLGSNGVIESGTHEELMDIKGAYWSMQK